ncbi:hypothetical protein H1C71_005356 [Ictidomys tridecemlineatus]|nr:hypothetical protein H1C71_005356 [Ictidomys tridecemlineatus]
MTIQGPPGEGRKGTLAAGTETRLCSQVHDGRMPRKASASLASSKAGPERRLGHPHHSAQAGACSWGSQYAMDGAGDVAQAVARSPGMRAAQVRSSAPHTNKDVVSAEN